MRWRLEIPHRRTSELRRISVPKIVNTRSKYFERRILRSGVDKMSMKLSKEPANWWFATAFANEGEVSFRRWEGGVGECRVAEQRIPEIPKRVHISSYGKIQLHVEASIQYGRHR